MYGMKSIETQTILIQSKQRPLAPAPERLPFNKRKFSNYAGAMPSQPPASVVRRNARERNRVKQVNNGFAALRQHIPANILATFGAGEAIGNGRNGSKKLSKVDTLRVAVEYIKSLQRLLEEHQENDAAGSLLGLYSDSRDVSVEFNPYVSVMPTPPTSESSVSPTPSNHSELSTSFPASMIFIQNGYREFEPKSLGDEELLDAIFSWQHSD